MGLLDWLTEAMGGDTGRGMSLDLPPGAMRGMPPPQDMGNAAPPLSPGMQQWAPPGAPPEAAMRFMSGPPPPVQAMDGPMGRPAWGPDAGPIGGMPPPMSAVPEPMMPPGSLPPPPPAMEQARFNPAQSMLPPPPVGPAPGGPPPAALPVAGGAGLPPAPPAGPPMNLAAPAQGMMPPPPMTITREAPGDTGTSLIGRALGLSSGTERGLRGSLAGGMKGIAANYNKPGLAAFAGGFGGALEGGEAADDKNTKDKSTAFDQKVKALSAAISAKKVGNDEAYNTKYLDYQVKNAGDKLQLEREKMTAGVAGKNFKIMPESQKVRLMEKSIAEDPVIKSLQKRVEGAAKLGIDAETNKAQAELKAAVADKQKRLSGAMGLSPQTMASLEGNPFGTETRPHDLSGIKTQAEAENFVKPGEWFINPKDGALKQRKGGPGTASASPPPTPSSVVSPPAASPAAADDGDDED